MGLKNGRVCGEIVTSSCLVFSEFNKVLYVEPRYSFKKFRSQLKCGNLILNDLRKDFRKNRISKINTNLYVYHSPLYIPVSGRFPLNMLMLFIWRKRLEIELHELNIESPIIWLSRPEMVDLIGGFNEKMVIYHVVDEYLAYSGVGKEQRKILESHEKRMMTKADLVIVVSEKLFDVKRQFNRNTYLIPNGVDFQTYSRVADTNHPMPKEIEKLPRPIIGYSGLISRKLDLELINYLANKHPEWSISLMGVVNERFCKSDLCRLRQMKNVYFLGFRGITKVPYYLKAFDVCLVPYIVNEHAKNISPLKIYDYMALGKPIVATDIPAAHKFKDVIRIATSKEEFARHVEAALNEKNPDLNRKRRQVASQNTWDKRVSRLSQLIQNHFQRSD